MIRYLFNVSPGPWWVRATVAGVIAAACVVALFAWGFPLVDRLVPLESLTVR